MILFLDRLICGEVFRFVFFTFSDSLRSIYPDGEQHLSGFSTSLMVHVYTDDSRSADELERSNTEHLPRMQEEMPPPPDMSPQDGPSFPCGIVKVEYMDEESNSNFGMLHQNVDQEDRFPQVGANV